MVSYSQKIKGKYDVKSYQDTKNTYEWILRAINKMQYQPTKIRLHFHFKIGNISCTCEAIDEFVENAYGVSEYSLVNMSVTVFSSDTNSIYLSVDSSNDIFISADSKRELEEIFRLLDSTKLGEEEINDPISVTYIEHQDNRVTVSGNGNVIANNHSIITDKPESAESKIGKWVQGVCQGIVANLMWWVLGLVVIAILAWAVSKGYISMHE